MNLELVDVSLPATFLVTGNTSSPTNVDYDILGLHKKRTFLKGRLTVVEYYLSYDIHTDSYAGLAVQEVITWNEISGYLFSREKEISWYLSDGQVGLTKHTQKYYTLTESMSEGVIRRQNIIGDIKAHAILRLGEMNAADLLITLKPFIDLYLEAVVAPLVNEMGAIDKPYLEGMMPDGTQSIRVFFVQELSF